MALPFGRRERPLHQGKPDAPPSERRLDREGAKQQRRGFADADRRQPDGADQQGADPRREGEIDEVHGAFANAERRAGIAPGAIGTFVKPLDDVGIGGRFG
jgi:hypothetical protein